MARVLIVEDEAVLQRTFRQFLEEEGLRVGVAASYDEAVADLAREDSDVVVTDILLGGKTGIDLLRDIQREEPGCQVIVITGNPSLNTATEAVRLGAFDYLAKPVTGEALKKAVRLALDRKRLSDERDNFAAQSEQYRRELEVIFNSVREGLVTVDEGLHVRYMNRAAREMLGAELRESGRSLLPEVLGTDFPGAFGAVDETVNTGEPSGEFRVESTLRGEKRVFMMNTAPLEDARAGGRGAVLVIRDITRLVRLEAQVGGESEWQDMVGKSAGMRRIFALIQDLSDTDSTVLINGESGTGKELIAAAIHHTSGRAKGPFVKVNCAALHEDILESELFGHVKGAFTGAIKDRIGRFELADKGTIFLDEIGDISPRLQLRLLRVLQEREFERVGDSRPIRTDVRVIAATNQDLVGKIRRGEFRQDLYYRLNVVRLDVPPLRDRREDIPVLVDHFLRKFNAQFNKAVSGFSPEAMDTLLRHSWPGNVRELENCIERALILCREGMVEPKHLPAELTEHDAPRVAAAPASAGKSGGNTREISREAIVEVLSQTDWNVSKSARRLGMSRNTLYQKMRAYDVGRPGS